MADNEPSSDRLEAVIAKLAIAQLHSTVILASMVSKLDVILLKLHILVTNQPSSYFPSTKSPLIYKSMDSATITTLVAQPRTETILSMSLEKQLSTPLAPMPLRPVLAPEFLSKMPLLVMKPVTV